MQKLLLIGGGENGRGDKPYETKVFDEEVVKMTAKQEPNFLFIGLASSFSDSYYDTMKKIYKELGCITVYLKKKNIINNPDIAKNKILNADIIYICGGDSIKLIETINEYHLEQYLKEAQNKGAVLCGISAGAIMLSKEGYSDSRIIRNESDKYEFIDGLNLIPISFCPHYKKGSTKSNEIKKDLKNTNKIVYALENGSAIEVIDDSFRIITSIEGAKAYKCFYENKTFKEIELNENIWESINNLVC